MTVRVLAVDPFHEDGLSLLRDRPDIDLTCLPEPTPAAMSAEMETAEILLLRGRHLPPVDFKSARRLKLVSRHGVGCDNLDLPQLEARGIGLAVSADANRVSVAEQAFALMLAAAKNILLGDRAARRGDWAQRSAMQTVDVMGRTLLVVGLGRIGRGFAERVRAFGAHVLINTARGGIVDETALVAALDAGQPLRYASDVLLDEPSAPDHPLFGRDDVILCPHSVVMTHDGVIRMATDSAHNVLDSIDGRLSPAATVIAPQSFQRDAS